MHDPDVVVFDIHVPVPMQQKWRKPMEGEPRWAIGRVRYSMSAVDETMQGKPIYPWWRPVAWRPTVAGRRFGWWKMWTVWHEEPGERDSGTVCKGMRGSQLTWHNVHWAINHRKHLRVVCGPYGRVKFWLRARCADCGRRFSWKEPKFSTGWDSKGTLHESCSNVRHLKHRLEDAEKALTFTADQTERWRVEQRLKYREEKAAES